MDRENGQGRPGRHVDQGSADQRGLFPQATGSAIGDSRVVAAMTAIAENDSHD
jgi:hypothetical protein